MFLAGVRSGRIDQPDEAELADLSEPAERGGVDDAADPSCERHVDARRYPDAGGCGPPAADFRDIVDGAHESNLFHSREKHKRAQNARNEFASILLWRTLENGGE